MIEVISPMQKKSDPRFSSRIRLQLQKNRRDGSHAGFTGN